MVSSCYEHKPNAAADATSPSLPSWRISPKASSVARFWLFGVRVLATRLAGSVPWRTQVSPSSCRTKLSPTGATSSRPPTHPWSSEANLSSLLALHGPAAAQRGRWGCGRGCRRRARWRNSLLGPRKPDSRRRSFSLRLRRAPHLHVRADA
jgi:hypothetical protein